MSKSDVLIEKENDNSDISTEEENRPSSHGGRLSAPAVDDNQPLSNTNSTNTNIVGDKSPKKKEKIGDKEENLLGTSYVDDILLFQPNLKIGNKRENFDKDFTLIIRADGRTVTVIETIIGWCSNSPDENYVKKVSFLL